VNQKHPYCASGLKRQNWTRFDERVCAWALSSGNMGIHGHTQEGMKVKKESYVYT